MTSIWNLATRRVFTKERNATVPIEKRLPCQSCPFRRDIDFSLSADRVRSILLALQGDEDFACHNTTAATGCRPGNEKACIGAAIFLERTRAGGVRANLSFRLRESEYEEFSRESLDMDAPVFETEIAFIAARAEPERIKQSTPTAPATAE